MSEHGYDLNECVNCGARFYPAALDPMDPRKMVWCCAGCDEQGLIGSITADMDLTPDAAKHLSPDGGAIILHVDSDGRILGHDFATSCSATAASPLLVVSELLAQRG